MKKLACLVFLLAALYAQAQPEWKSYIDSLRKERTTLEASLLSIERELSSLKRQINEQKKDNESMQNELDGLKQSLKDRESELKEKKQQLLERRAMLERQEQRLLESAGLRISLTNTFTEYRTEAENEMSAVQNRIVWLKVGAGVGCAGAIGLAVWSFSEKEIGFGIAALALAALEVLLIFM